VKLGIQSRLFIAFTGTIAVVVLAMAVAVNWSFQRGLEDYLSQVEMKRLDRIAVTLSSAYGEAGNWEFVRHNHRAWHDLLNQALGQSRGSFLRAAFTAPNDAEPTPPPPPGARPWSGPPGGNRPDHPPPRPALGGRPPGHPEGVPGFAETPPLIDDAVPLPPPRPRARPAPPPVGPVDRRPRLRLFDGAGELVFGPAQVKDDEIRHPIAWADETVGYLALQRNKLITDELARGFQIGQRRTYVLVAGLALLLAALASMWLARRLLRPVRRITAGARDLGAGHYGIRILVDRGDELGRLAEDFNHLASALERNEQTRRQWIADISHELRTPLAVLQSEIEALIDGVRPTSAVRLHSLHGEVLDLGKLVDDLYELALSDIGALDYRREPLDLAELIEHAAEGFRPRCTVKDLQLINRVSGPLPFTGDARRLQQLFNNLLENSLRYTDPGGRMEIDQETSADAYHLRLQDTAPGVPDEALPHLFERLYRVDKSRSRSQGGTGLGLAICRSIVEAHDGRIEVEHSPLGGLATHIHLPRTK